MKKIKKGSIVGRKSYGKDVIFVVKNIIKFNGKEFAILKGMVERIEADCDVIDLELIEEERVKEVLNNLDRKIGNRKRYSDKLDKNYKIGIVTNNRMARRKIITGKILHLDGDKKYTEKSYRYYRRLGLDAIVKNVPEYRQPKVVYNLLKTYNPDILVVTGHDGMLKKGSNYNDIYNYRNSKYFIETVKEARRYDSETRKNLVIFAGACQSYFEALILAGANFASSPARILIDFMDPLIVAEKVAITEKYKYVTIDDIAKELRDGKKGVGGIGADGKMQRL